MATRVSSRLMAKAKEAAKAGINDAPSPVLSENAGKSKTRQKMLGGFSVYIICLGSGNSVVIPACIVDEAVFLVGRGWVKFLMNFRAGHRPKLPAEAIPGLRAAWAPGKQCRFILSDGEQCQREVRCKTGACSKHHAALGQGCEYDHFCTPTPCPTGPQNLNAVGAVVCQDCSQNKMGVLTNTRQRAVLALLAQFLDTILLCAKVTAPASSATGDWEVQARIRVSNPGIGQWLSNTRMVNHATQAVRDIRAQLIRLLQHEQVQSCLTQLGSLARVTILDGVVQAETLDHLSDFEWQQALEIVPSEAPIEEGGEEVAPVVVVGVEEEEILAPPLVPGGGGLGTVLVAVEEAEGEEEGGGVLMAQAVAAGSGEGGGAQEEKGEEAKGEEEGATQMEEGDGEGEKGATLVEDTCSNYMEEQEAEMMGVRFNPAAPLLQVGVRYQAAAPVLQTQADDWVDTLFAHDVEEGGENGEAPMEEEEEEEEEEEGTSGGGLSENGGMVQEGERGEARPVLRLLGDEREGEEGEEEKEDAAGMDVETQRWDVRFDGAISTGSEYSDLIENLFGDV